VLGLEGGISETIKLVVGGKVDIFRRLKESNDSVDPFEKT